MKKITLYFLLVISVMLIGMSSKIEAFEFPAAFKIKGIKVSLATNYHYRIISNTPSAWLCSGGPTNDSWAYINEGDSGSDGKIITLSMAYAMNKWVYLTTEYVGGYCHIVELEIRD